MKKVFYIAKWKIKCIKLIEKEAKKFNEEVKVQGTQFEIN